MKQIQNTGEDTMHIPGVGTIKPGQVREVPDDFEPVGVLVEVQTEAPRKGRKSEPVLKDESEDQG